MRARPESAGRQGSGSDLGLARSWSKAGEGLTGGARMSATARERSGRGGARPSWAGWWAAQEKREGKGELAELGQEGGKGRVGLG